MKPFSDVIKQRYRYDKVLGQLVNNKGKVVKYVQINSKRYRSYHIIFYMHYKRLPKMIDHINRDREDNRIENLRECDYTLNNRNRRAYGKRKALYKLIVERKGRYYLQASIDGRTHSIYSSKNLNDVLKERQKYIVSNNYPQEVINECARDLNRTRNYSHKQYSEIEGLEMMK